MNKKLKITDLVSNDLAVMRSQGLEVYEIIYAHLLEGNTEISFEGVRRITSLFANASIGKIYLNCSPELCEKMTLTGIEADSTISLIIDKAIDAAQNAEEHDRIVMEAYS